MPSTVLLICILTLQPVGYYDVAPPGQAPVPVATGNDYAPTPAGAAIVLRTDLTLRLTTSQSFIGTSQTNFATAMRSLLAPYGFMSVAVTGFAVRLTSAPRPRWPPNWPMQLIR